jgi:hypothetical protein
MSEQDPSSDLIDLKMLPAWATESPNDNRYADFAGEEQAGPGQRERRGGEPAGFAAGVAAASSGESEAGQKLKCRRAER